MTTPLDEVIERLGRDLLPERSRLDVVEQSGVVSDLAALLDYVEELRHTVIAFAGPFAVRYSDLHGLGKDTLHPQHYDLLKDCGARMFDFIRADLAAPDPDK